METKIFLFVAAYTILHIIAGVDNMQKTMRTLESFAVIALVVMIIFYMERMAPLVIKVLTILIAEG